MSAPAGPTRIRLRIRSADGQHVKVSVFIGPPDQSQLCGELVLSHAEYQLLGAALHLAQPLMQGRLLVETDSIEEFFKTTEPPKE